MDSEAAPSLTQENFESLVAELGKERVHSYCACGRDCLYVFDPKETGRLPVGRSVQYTKKCAWCVE